MANNRANNRVKLASGTLLGGSSPKLSPTQIRTNVDIRPGQVNPNAGRVQNTATPIAEPIMRDSFGEAIESATNRLVDAAFRYQEKRDQLEADEGVLNFRSKTREAFFGAPTPDGKMSIGYGGLERKAAVDGFDTYRETIAQISKSVLDGKSDSVKTKMMFAIQREKDAAIERGVSHNFRQFKLHEENVRFQEKEDILRDIELNGVQAFKNGTVASHLAKYSNLQEQAAAEEFLATQSMYMTYNDAYESASNNPQDVTPALTAYKATTGTFEDIRGGVSEATENSLQNWMKSKQGQAEAQAKAALRERQTRFKNEVLRSAPEGMAIGLSNGNFEFVHNGIKGMRQVLSDTPGSDKKIVSSLKDAFEFVVNNGGGSTLSDKRLIGIEAYNKLISSGDSLSVLERMELGKYVSETLPRKIQSDMNFSDSLKIAQRDADLARSLSSGEMQPINEVPPAGMLPSNQAKWYRQNATYKNSFKGVLSGYTKDKASAYLIAAHGKLVDGKLSNSEMDKLQELSIEGLIPPGEYAKLFKLNREKASSSSKKNPWQNTAAYAGAMGRIKASAYQFAGAKPVKPKKAKDMMEYNEKLADWHQNSNQGIQQAKLEMDKAARLAYDNKQEFDASTWWKEYVKNGVNNGSIVSPVMERSVFQRVKDFINPGREALSGDIKESQFMFDLTGDPAYLPTMMDDEDEDAN
jgi:hypothetical protein